MVILPSIKAEKKEEGTAIPLPKIAEGDDIFVGINFTIRKGKLWCKGGFVKQKKGVSQTQKTKQDDKKALKSQAENEVYL